MESAAIEIAEVQAAEFSDSRVTPLDEMELVRVGGGVGEVSPY